MHTVAELFVAEQEASEVSSNRFQGLAIKLTSKLIIPKITMS